MMDIPRTIEHLESMSEEEIANYDLLAETFGRDGYEATLKTLKEMLEDGQIVNTFGG